MKITNISLKNFKCIDSLEYSPGMINVFVGRNNTGKTSLLEAISLSFEDNIILPKYMSHIGRPDTIINYKANCGSVKLELNDYSSKNISVLFRRATGEEVISNLTKMFKEVVNHSIKVYKFVLERNEIKKSPNSKTTKRMADYLKAELITEETVEAIIDPDSLNNLIKFSLYFERNGTGRLLLGKNAEKILYDLLMELVSKIGEGEIPKGRDEEFFYLLRRYIWDYIGFGTRERFRANNIRRKENSTLKTPTMIIDPQEYIDKIQYNEEMRQNIALQIEQVIKKDGLVPGLERFNFDSLVFTGVDRDVPIDSMGDGFKALVGLLCSFFAESNGGIFLLEEPEVHMHPGYVRELVNYLVKISRTLNTQFFISTHSLDLIEDFLDVSNFSKENKEFVKSELKIVRFNNNEEFLMEEYGFPEAVNNVQNLSLDLRGF
jgi:AAA15 family ATPase/GTPase